jgi:N-acetylglucosamine kinase-like BadF-type ATPase
LIEGLVMGQYFIGSDHAPLVHKVALQGDPVAQSIVKWAGEELGLTALAVIRQLEIAALEFEVVLVGSIYEMGEMIISPMRNVITSEAPLARLVRLSAPPVVGGVLLAMDLLGLNTSTLREYLITSTTTMLKGAAS